MKEVQPSEGKRLRRASEKGKECLKCAVGRVKTDARIGPSTINVQEFRPTAPGHSPGVGHSLKDKGVDKKINISASSYMIDSTKEETVRWCV
ncbi:hypothetical protein QJS10_CPB19g01675 [Acorus calamus]|uniref:Uncharacterized protein n=1 Tax=Acorus calamus TaxID=4465 RepID=A0AAV9CL09_ACOCL|nr:hypothetical protein QJS10_CPB19g01675 [Acorus calamus]